MRFKNGFDNYTNKTGTEGKTMEAITDSRNLILYHLWPFTSSLALQLLQQSVTIVVGAYFIVLG